MNTMAEAEEKTKGVFDIDIKEMAQVGVHFGHSTSKIHPKMKRYLWGVREGVHIINLQKSAEKLKEALKFIQQLVSENKVILMVGTKIQVRELVKEVAEACGFPYVIERWLGGTFTNFNTISQRIQYLNELEKKIAEGEFEKYTKKEQAKIKEELQSLKRKFEGMRNLTQLPDAVFVIDMKKDYLAVKEARMKNIKVIGICDTNADPTLADYPIPGNDDAISSVRYILNKVKEAVFEVKGKREKKEEEKGEKEEKNKNN